ncbi:hypothetical protein OIU76_018942 [Salix suchowensis]|nr:hypothetical protein OIU76_018942 [Salix suchowensis]
MSAAVAAAAAAANMSCNSPRINSPSGTPTSYQLQKGLLLPSPSPPSPISLPLLPLSRYESQKRRDWNTFGQYLRNHRPPLALARCSGAHVLEFLSLTRHLLALALSSKHGAASMLSSAVSVPPLRRTAGLPETNPFGARAVRLYLREVRDAQAKARGIAYEKKKRKNPTPTPQQQQQKTQTAVNGTYGHLQQGIGNGGTGGYDPRNALSNGAAVHSVGDVSVFN